MKHLKIILLISFVFISLFADTKERINSSSNDQIHFTLFGDLPTVEKYFIKPLNLFSNEIAERIKSDSNDTFLFSYPTVIGDTEKLNLIIAAYITKNLLSDSIKFGLDSNQAENLRNQYSTKISDKKELLRNGISPTDINNLVKNLNKLVKDKKSYFNVEISYSKDIVLNNFIFTAKFVNNLDLKNIVKGNSVAIQEVKTMNVYFPEYIIKMSSKFLKIRLIVYSLMLLSFLLASYFAYYYLKHRKVREETQAYIDEISTLMGERKYVASVMKIQQALYFHPNSPELNELKARIKLFIGDKFSKEAAEEAEKVMLITRKVERVISESNVKEAKALQIELKKYDAIPEAKEGIERLESLKKSILELEDMRGRGERENAANEIFSAIKTAMKEGRITDAVIKFIKQEEFINGCYEYEEIKAKLKLAVGAVDGSINEKDAEISGEVDELRARYNDARIKNDYGEIERICEILKRYSGGNKNAMKLETELDVLLKPEREKRRLARENAERQEKEEKIKYLESLIGKDDILEAAKMASKFKNELSGLRKYTELEKILREKIGDRTGRIDEATASVCQEVMEIEKMVAGGKMTMNADNFEKLLYAVKQHEKTNARAERCAKTIEKELSEIKNRNRKMIMEIIGAGMYEKLHSYLAGKGVGSGIYRVNGTTGKSIQVKIGRESTIGRESSEGALTDFAVPSVYQAVSRKHGTLFVKSGKLHYRDNKSTLGTFFGENKISETVISEGDILSLGKKYNIVAVLQKKKNGEICDVTMDKKDNSQESISGALFVSNEEAYLLLISDYHFDKEIKKALDLPADFVIRFSTDGERLFIINESNSVIFMNGEELPPKAGWIAEEDITTLKLRNEKIEIRRFYA